MNASAKNLKSQQKKGKIVEKRGLLTIDGQDSAVVGCECIVLRPSLAVVKTHHVCLCIASGTTKGLPQNAGGQGRFL